MITKPGCGGDNFADCYVSVIVTGDQLGKRTIVSRYSFMHTFEWEQRPNSTELTI